MRKTRIGALLASTALASATVLGGAAVANASTEDVLGSLDVGGSLFPEAEEPEADEPEAGETDTVRSEGNYIMTATAFDNCTVQFTLQTERDEDYGNWRGDYQVNDEPPITEPGSDPSVGNRGETYRPALGSNQNIEEAIDGTYDFGTRDVMVDLTEERRVPDFAGGAETLPGVEANENGEHIINFGVYQGPPGYTEDIYNTNGSVTVTGCPTTEDEDDSGPLGSLDVFGSLES